MESLLIEQGEFTPFVSFDSSSGILKIKGKSLPEDSRSFYKPLLSWVEEHGASSNIVLIIHLDYINSSSSKQLLKLFYLLEDLFENSDGVQVKWLHSTKDELLRERGEELAQMIELPFEVKASD